ncbi:enoyl-CoA hydratase [compost metagenome]
MKATLASARQTVDQGEKVAAAALQSLAQRLLDTEDAAEGLRAMQERREGHFKGK